MTHLSETVGIPGAYEVMRELEASSITALTIDDLAAIMAENGMAEPDSSIEDFVAANLLNKDGDRFSLTTLGIRTSILMEALNGGDLRDVYRRLSRIDNTLRAYELVREGMTEVFLRNLVERPGFGRLYICSPWISLDRKQEELLVQAVSQVEKRRNSRPEIFVVTRPADGTGQVPTTLGAFQGLGATIFLNPRLHTKLYIREPDSGGGYAMAILGSQNLTKSNYLELGVRINSDSQMIGQLITYYYELMNHSREV